MSPTQRTLAECRRRGWTAQVVERWNQYAKRRIDLFNVIDIVAITPQGIMGIQACAGSSHAARRTKALETPTTNAWIGAGGIFEIWSWAKRGERGKRKLWALRAERLNPAEQWCNCVYEVGSGGQVCDCGKPSRPVSNV